MFLTLKVTYVQLFSPLKGWKTLNGRRGPKTTLLVEENNFIPLSSGKWAKLGTLGSLWGYTPIASPLLVWGPKQDLNRSI